MADYSHYLGPAPEWTSYEKAYVAHATSIIQPGSTQLEIRDAINTDRAIQHLNAYGRPDDVKVDEFSITTSDGLSIPARLYRPKEPRSTTPLPLYIHWHSGGWHLGTLETEEPYCMQLCSAFSHRESDSVPGLAVLNVNYRHTPEFIFPTQPNDAWDAFELFVANDPSSLAVKYGTDPTNIVLGGTSAGATLSINTAVKEMRRAQKEGKGGRNRIKGLLLTAPSTVHVDLFPFQSLRSKEVSSLEQCKTVTILPTPRVRFFMDMFIPSEADRAIRAGELISPLLIPDESIDSQLWPPSVFHICGLDSLRDDGLLFEEKLRKIGVKTKLTVYAGYPHAFNLFPHLAETSKWNEAVIEELAQLIKS